MTLEADIPGYFTENVFTLMPGEEKTAMFIKKNDGQTLGEVKVRSYNQMMNYLK